MEIVRSNLDGKRFQVEDVDFVREYLPDYSI